MPKSLPRIAYEVGKRFGYEKLTVVVNPNFRETKNSRGKTIANSVFTEPRDGNLFVYLSIPKHIPYEEKIIRIAHEFGEIKFKEKHPKISKMLHVLCSRHFIEEIPRHINEFLADEEARKRGFKIPYSYHLS